jgi:hypothetical protein
MVGRNNMFVQYFKAITTEARRFQSVLGRENYGNEVKYHGGHKDELFMTFYGVRRMSCHSGRR